MEQNYIEKQVKNQIQLIVRGTNSEVKYSALRFQSKLKLSNIFLIRNKGKGPPGRMRSPGMAYCPTRDNQPVYIENELQMHIKPNFLSQLNLQL
ncbi:MAG: hypothetical protein PHP53_18595 [Prolixibacteraceae bacterium]|nr:hypothetical protein [Prolixibacteraceae bacterium]